MRKIRNMRPVWAALAVAGALGVAGSAWAAGLPSVQTQGLVAFITGGVGMDEAKAFQAEATKWPVMLEFSVKDRKAGPDAYLANVELQVLDAKKAVVLDTHSGGPFVLARLQPGHYQVKATFDGKTMTRAMHVTGKRTAREVFVWPHAAEKAGS